MRDVFKNPPASVQEACELFLKAKGVEPGDKAAPILREAVAFGSVAAAGRQMAKVAPGATARNVADDLVQVMRESSQVFAEANQVQPLPGSTVN